MNIDMNNKKQISAIYFSILKILCLLGFFGLSACASIQPVPIEHSNKKSAIPEPSLSCSDYLNNIRNQINSSGYQDNQFLLLHNNPELRLGLISFLKTQNQLS